MCLEANLYGVNNGLMIEDYMRTSEKLPQLSISRFEELRALFLSKGWPIEEEELSLFERFYRTLLLLDGEEQDFLLKFSYVFDRITGSDYFKHMKGILKKLRQETDNKKLIFTTCTPREDVGLVKSSMAVLYQLKGTTIKQYVDMTPYKVLDINKLSEYPINKDSYIILVDDFLGTGRTAKAAIDFIHELVPTLTDNSRIMIFCIAALEEGIKALAEIGVKTYCSIIRRKAITDEMEGADKEYATTTMIGIEDKLNGLKDDFRFGYGKSEAMICMERCPNNTFPIYWLTKKVAPYER